MAGIHQQVENGHQNAKYPFIFMFFRSGEAFAIERGRRSYEKQIARSPIIGRKLAVRRAGRGCGSRHWPAASPARSSGGCGTRPWLRLGRRLLVSGWRALGMAWRLLGSPGLCGRPLVRAALLRWPVLPRLLAPLGKPAAAHGATLLNATGHRVFPA